MALLFTAYGKERNSKGAGERRGGVKTRPGLLGFFPSFFFSFCAVAAA